MYIIMKWNYEYIMLGQPSVEKIFEFQYDKYLKWERGFAMYDKTSSAQFKKYGSIYDEPKDLHSDELIQREVVTTDRVISSLYHFS